MMWKEFGWADGERGGLALERKVQVRSRGWPRKKSNTMADLSEEAS